MLYFIFLSMLSVGWNGVKKTAGIGWNEIKVSSCFFSYSERMAAIPNWKEYPTDFEYRTGFKTKHFRSEWLWEREIGHYGSGRENEYVISITDLNFKNHKLGSIEIGGKDYVRTVWDINYQEQYCLYKVECFNFEIGTGMSYFWEDNFNDPKVCLKSTISFFKGIDLKFSQETNFNDRCYRNFYIGKGFLFKLPFLSPVDFRLTACWKRVWKNNELIVLQNKGKLDLELDFAKVTNKFEEFLDSIID